MNTQHTPGPWSIELDHAINAPEIIRAHIDGEMHDLASVLCDETGNASANARLISSAPDLLAALQAICSGNVYGDPDEWNRRVDLGFAAIAKATGEAA